MLEKTWATLSGERPVRDVCCCMVAWELLFRCAQLVLRRSSHPSNSKLVVDGPSYVAAFIHACLVGGLGLWHAVTLLHAPVDGQLTIPVDNTHAWNREAAATERTNVFFLSWLLYDLVHVLLRYPHLGGLDTVAHHLGFIGASIICSTYRILPFPFAWLTTGELSSIALNIRWFLINSGHGDSSALHVAQLAFALLFAVTRVLIYGLGLVHLAMHQHELLSTSGALSAVPTPLVLLVLGLLVGGYCLNLMWMGKIVRMATRRREPRRKD